MNLWEYEKERALRKASPLAFRMKPSSLDDFVGQEHIIGKGKILYRAIMADRISSLIFYGPPGTGKTSLAKIISTTTKSKFLQLNATTSGKKEIQEMIQAATQYLAVERKRTILFIDEIHRFNKSQQDSLLPYVENGTIIFIGATTENPYFEVNQALLSRSLILELYPLAFEQILLLLQRALESPEGLLHEKLKVDEDALKFFARMAEGDARIALNALELAVLTQDADDYGIKHIDLDAARDCIQKKTLRYDKNGDFHYDVISAFIKSMRGSDPDAAIFYLTLMLKAGEDPKFIARRMLILASEDIGNADPQALVMASSAHLAVERVGLPEAEIILSQCVLYLATAPKSNSAITALANAKDALENHPLKSIPNHLKSTAYKGAKALGHGKNYLYAHDFPNHYVSQQYLPDEIKTKHFYHPSENGFEKKIKAFLDRIRGDENKA